MKIAMCSRVYNKKGGISRYVAELAEHFSYDNEVHVFASDWEYYGDKINFHRTPLPNRHIVMDAGVYFLEMSYVSKFMKNQFDVIHTQGLESFWLDVVTAHSIHKAGLDSLKNDGMPQSFGVTDKFLLTIEDLNYRKYRNYRKIIADATSGKRELMKYYGVPEEDIEVIPLGVDMNEFRPMEKDDGLMKIYGIDNSHTVLIIVATEFYRKGMTELIESMRILNRKDVKLLIVGRARSEGNRVGDGFYRDLVTKYGLNDRIIFTGEKSGNELVKHYNLADIFVFPTKYEGFGIPTVEAMSCGLPVIVGRSGAGGDLITEKNGFLLDDVNNPQEIADKIEVLVNDENLRRMMGKQERKDVEVCSWENVSRRVMDVYRSVTE